MAQLPIVKIGKKKFFADRRLGQLRNIHNPHDFEDVSVEVIDFLIDNRKEPDNEQIRIR